MSSSTVLRNARQFALRSAVRNPAYVRYAAASSDSASLYVPGGPVYKGTVNDPTDYPPPSRTHGSYHWAFERLLSASLIPLTGAAFAGSTTAYPVLDGLLAITLVMHSHIGFQALLTDYLHPRKFGVFGKATSWGLKAATVGVLVGVYQFNTNDIGLTELIAKAWTA